MLAHTGSLDPATSATPQPAPTGKQRRTARALAVHVAAGLGWFIVGGVFDFLRYWDLFCDIPKPASVDHVSIGLTVSWLPVAAVVYSRAVRGARAWPWSVVWFLGSTVVYGLVVFGTPAPAQCISFF